MGEALTQPQGLANTSEELVTLIENAEHKELFDKLHGKFVDFVAVKRAEILAEIGQEHGHKEYHNREHTEETADAHIETLKIGQKWNLLEGPNELALAVGELAAIYHDYIHFRGKDEDGLGAEDLSAAAYQKAVSEFFDAITPESDEAKQVIWLYKNEALRRGYDQIMATQINSVTFREVTDDLKLMDESLGEKFTPEEAACLEAHFNRAFPPKKTEVLDIHSTNVGVDSSFSVKSKERADVGYGGRVDKEKAFRAGDAEYIELDREKDENDPDITKRPAVPVLKDPESYTSERIAAAVANYLGHLDQQPGFFYNRWSIDEMLIQNDPRISVHTNRDEILDDLRKQSPNWKENIFHTLDRYESLEAEYGRLRDANGFEGEAVNDNRTAVKRLYAELTTKFNTAA